MISGSVFSYRRSTIAKIMTATAKGISQSGKMIKNGISISPSATSSAKAQVATMENQMKMTIASSPNDATTIKSHNGWTMSFSMANAHGSASSTGMMA